MAIKFNKHNVTNTDNGEKARVFYSHQTLINGREVVTLYDKDYGHALSRVFPGMAYENDTDSMTDYFDKGRVRIPVGHPLFAAALARANSK